MVSSIDKFDVELLLNDFRITNKEALTFYLKELWKDLSQRSEDKLKGVNRITFSKFYDLPGIILDRLFNVFDSNKNEYLDINEFVEGMITICMESFDKLIKFIFKFYDFDNDDYVTYDDLKVVLSYIPLNTQIKVFGNKSEGTEYKDRIESQEEIKKMLDKCFEKEKKIDFKTFSNIVENQNSEICIFILIFLLEKKPFNQKTLVPYEAIAKTISKSPDVNNNTSKMIASPNLNSKFSPCITISKSPSITKKTLDLKGVSNNPLLGKLTGKNPINEAEPKSKLLMYTKTGTSNLNIDNKNPVRKTRGNDLRNIEDMEGKKKIINIDVNKNKDVEESSDNYTKEIQPATKYHNHIINIKTDKVESDDDDLGNDIKYEGWLYKLTQTKKLKKLYFKLINRDIFCKTLFYLRL